MSGGRTRLLARLLDVDVTLTCAAASAAGSPAGVLAQALPGSWAAPPEAGPPHAWPPAARPAGTRDVGAGPDARRLEVEVARRPDGTWALTTPSGVDVVGPDDLLVGLSTVLNREVLVASRYLTLHAGVVAVDGVTLAWPAPSGAGKSTLVAAALRRGFDYVSDEALCLDTASRAVLPYAKPLVLSAWTARAVGLAEAPRGERGYLPGELGARARLDPPTLRHVVLPERAAAPAGPTLEPATSAEAVVALLHRCFNAYVRPEASLAALSAVASAARCWRLRYSEPLAAAELLRELAAAH